MKMNDRLKWMEANGRTVSDGSIAEAESIVEAEEYVSRYPVDGHGFATSAVIGAESQNDAMAMLAEAGYTWSGEGKGRGLHKDGFAARVTVSRYKTVSVFIGPRKGWVAMATGEGGYLQPDDRPEV